MNGGIGSERYIALRNISDSVISVYGPLLIEVSARSHFMMFSSGIPIFWNSSTAPFPHLPNAPRTKARGSFPAFASPSFKAARMSLSNSPSFG